MLHLGGLQNRRGRRVALATDKSIRLAHFYGRMKEKTAERLSPHPVGVFLHGGGGDMACVGTKIKIKIKSILSERSDPYRMAATYATTPGPFPRPPRLDTAFSISCVLMFSS